MSGLNDNIIQERSLHIPAHATCMMSKPQRKVSIGSFKQAGHGEHWYYTCGRAYAECGPETGVKPEQRIQFKESGVAGHGGRNRFGGRYAFDGDALRSLVRKARPLS